MTKSPKIRSTTILAVRRDGVLALAGDGQVSIGPTVVKHGSKKIRRLLDGAVLVGFAGGTADALTLLEKFEGILKEYKGNLLKASVELAKLWRTDRMYRRLECMMIAADAEQSFLLSGSGDVIESDDGVLAIGSGGNYALSAARALLNNTDLDAETIVRQSMAIAADICVYTNENIVVETLKKK